MQEPLLKNFVECRTKQKPPEHLPRWFPAFVATLRNGSGGLHQTLPLVGRQLNQLAAQYLEIGRPVIVFHLL